MFIRIKKQNENLKKSNRTSCRCVKQRMFGWITYGSVNMLKMLLSPDAGRCQGFYHPKEDTACFR